MSGPVPNVSGGFGTVQGIWDVDTTPQLPVGTRGWLPDGRAFYYARNSGIAMPAGQLLMSEIALVANTLAVNTAAIGDTTVTVTSGTPTADANDFESGYLNVVDDTGEGYTYKIRAHPAITASTDVVITLEHPINVAFAAATTVSIIKNPWMDPVIAAAAQAHFACGIPQVLVPAGSTTKQFFWCQTWGISGAWADGTAAFGAAISSGTVPGQTEINGGLDQTIGTQMLTAVDTEYQPLFLSIAP